MKEWTGPALIGLVDDLMRDDDEVANAPPCALLEKERPAH